MKEMFNRLSVGGVLERAAELVPDKIGVIEEAQSLTYRELNDMANSFASSLSGLGFRKGDRVAIYMKNSVELMVSFYALQKLGVIVTWVNPHYRKAEAQFILKNSGSKGVIIFEEWEGYNYLNAVMALKPSLPDLE
ncbi:MAG: AMP-binding protein, partial [Deltaproteobacteria bacterium]|nr:AMP-binding protein [Deltaproteobacteria bacterium]